MTEGKEWCLQVTWVDWLNSSETKTSTLSEQALSAGRQRRILGEKMRACSWTHNLYGYTSVQVLTPCLTLMSHFHTQH